jgi:hypothetical protein
MLFVLADYLIAMAVTELAKMKVQEQLAEDWPDPILDTSSSNDDDDDKTLKGATIEAEDEAFKPITNDKPYEDPLLDKSFIAKDVTKPIDELIVPEEIGAMYLLNPLSIIACMAQSTQVFSSMGAALAFMYASKGNLRLSMFCLALGAYLSIYPVILVAPCIMLLEKSTHQSVSFL